MEKRMINDVYTIEGIDSTSQLVAFYKEVVDKNIEKYVGITTQGIKFKVDSTGEKAIQLKPSEEYALNPLYRKVEVEPIEEIVEESVQPEVVIEPIEQVVEEVQQQEEIAVVEEVQFEPQPVVDEVSREELEEVQIKFEQEYQKNLELTQEKNLHKERAEAAELREEQLKQRNAELTAIIEEKDAKIVELTSAANEVKCECQTALTLDEALDYIKTLGYEAFIRKI